MFKVHVIKADNGEWQLDVLAVPFGGHVNGRDSQGEYFSKRTALYDDQLDPLIVYYHGLGPDGNPMGTPEIIGKAISHEVREDGVWYRVALNAVSEMAKRVWEAAKEGLAKASSGSIVHLVRTAANGEILNWPLAEISLFDTDEGRQPANQYAVALPAMRSMYQSAGISLPELLNNIQDDEADLKPADALPDGSPGAMDDTTNQPIKSEKEIQIMEQNEVKDLVAESVAAALKADRDAREAAEKLEAEKAAAVEAAVKAEKEKWEAEAAKSNRLPSDKQTPYVAKFADLKPYDNLSGEDLAVMAGVLQAEQARGKAGPSPQALKSLAIRMEADEKRYDPNQVTGGNAAKYAADGMRELRSRGMAVKSDELDYSTLASYGDEWVGVAYSNALWESIRVATFVVNKLPQVEVPQGMESIVLPLEGTDPVFYKVAESTATDATSGYPVASVTSSRMGTGNKTLSLAKMGARTLWSGELNERSLIPFAAQLRMQLQQSGSNYLEHAIIDGDTAAGASANINDIAGTPAGTEAFMLFNGFRKSCLVTTTANSRDGGVLTAEDFLETVKLMGTAGINALDVMKVGFILDVNTHWKAKELPEVKTRDVNVQATIESGKLVNMYGYEVYTSPNMHFVQPSRKANTAGKCDVDTAGNNTTGSILAVRWDQWKLGFQRRMTMETSRYPASDSNEIVALMTVGLAQRDTEASAITYNVTV